MSVILKIDDREQKVIEHIQREFVLNSTFTLPGPKPICEVGRLDIGDYIITKDDQLIAVIERKSLADYGASIKDGRTQNKCNLINLRNLTKCKIFYLIEGPLNSAYDRQFSRVNFSSILASIRRLQLIDDIQIIWSSNIEQTAKELRFLCEIIAKSAIETNDEQRLSKVECIEESLNKAKQTPEEKLKYNLFEVWSAIPGIGKQSAMVLAKKYTLAELILNKDKIDESPRINNAISQLIDFTPILATIKGITPVLAKWLLAEPSPVITRILENETKIYNYECYGKKVSKTKIAYLREILLTKI